MLGKLAYVITGQTGPLKASLADAQKSVNAADKGMKQGAKNITDSTKKMSRDATSAIDPMQQGLSAINPAAGQAVAGMRSASMGAKALNKALGPIGLAITAIGAAVAALTAYFTKSVEGQQKFANIMAYLGGVVDTVKDLFIDLGKWIVWAFENPQQAVKQLWETIKQNLINRFQGLVDMITAGWTVISKGAEGVGLAIAGIFSKEKREQAKQAFKEMAEGMQGFSKAALQATTGVEDLMEKMGDMGKEASGRARENMALQQRENQLWWDQLEAKIQLAEIDGEIAEARRIANDDTETATDQMHAMNRAADLVNQKYETRRRLIEEELAIQEERMALGHDDQADMERRNELQVQLINLKQEEENMSRTLLRRQTTINNRLEAERKARNEIFEQIKMSRMEEEERAVYGLQKALEQQLSAHRYTEQEKAEITAYYEGQIRDIREQAALEDAKARAEIIDDIERAGMSEVEIFEQTRDQILASHSWTEAERVRITAYYQGQIDDIRKQAAETDQQRRDEILERIRQSGMSQVDLMREQMEKELQLFAENAEQKAIIQDYWNQKIKEQTEGSLDDIAGAWNNMSEIAGGAMAGMANELGALMSGAEADFKSLAKSMLNSISQIINGLLAKAIAGMIAGEAQKGLFGLATAAIGVGAIKAMFASNVPQMASGGVIPSGYPNDTYPALLSSGETVIPPKKLGSMGGGVFKATFHGAGNDFYAWMKETDRRIGDTF